MGGYLTCVMDPKTKRLFGILQELKAALHPQGFLLTSTVSGIKFYIDQAYDIPAISKLVIHQISTIQVLNTGRGMNLVTMPF